MIVVLLILMLHQLTQLTKGFGTFWAIVRQVRHLLAVAPVRKHGSFTQVAFHLQLAVGKLVNLVAGIVLSETPSAVSTFDMLNRIRTRLEAFISTDGAGYILGTMNLHVHAEIVLVFERLVAFGASDLPIDTATAARNTRAFAPLISTKVARRTAASALGTAARDRTTRDAIDTPRGSSTLAPLVVAVLLGLTP